MAMHGNRTVPEHREQRPGIGSRDGREVHKGRQGRVAPVGDTLVDKVGDDDDLSAPEVVAGPEQDPGEDEEVVENKVAGYIGGGTDKSGIFGEEVPDVANLGEKQQNPGDGHEHDGGVDGWMDKWTYQ